MENENVFYCFSLLADIVEFPSIARKIHAIQNSGKSPVIHSSNGAEAFRELMDQFINTMRG